MLPLLAIIFMLATPSTAHAASAGDLLTCPDTDAVYELQDDGTRWVFPNDATFFTWYDDFDDVGSVSCKNISRYPLSGVVTYAPGSRLVKIQTDPKVYAVANGGVLNWIQTEADARNRYGANWNSLVDDVSVGFWPLYTIGEALDVLDSDEEVVESDIPAPDLVGPSVAISGESYTIDWSAVTGATEYILQEDDDDDFPSPTSTNFEIEDETKIAYTKTTASNQTYYYRIQTRISGSLSAWSDTISVQVKPLYLINGVPDINQPPYNSLRASITNGWSAPMAAANIFEYHDDHGTDFADSITGDLSDKGLGDYLGWFMDTNNLGSGGRVNAGNGGTLNGDIANGMQDFSFWEGGQPADFGFAVPNEISGKSSYTGWTFSSVSGTSPTGGWNRVKANISTGLPVLVVFKYWNPDGLGKTYNGVSIYTWGDEVESSVDSRIGTVAPVEEWNFGVGTSGIGHAVTAIGYILDYDAKDGNGEQDWIVVHDTWPSTPNPLAIPWNNFSYAVIVSPGENKAPSGTPSLSGVEESFSGETFVLSWGRATAATYYEIEWDTSSGFINPSSSTTEVGGQIYEFNASQTVSVDTTYYYRIRAMNEYGAGDWSSKLEVDIVAP
ncbi:MAG: hypothetical protein ABIA47_01870 [bacterium]